MPAWEQDLDIWKAWIRSFKAPASANTLIVLVNKIHILLFLSKTPQLKNYELTNIIPE